MAIAFVQSKGAQSAGATSHPVTFDAGPTQNNLIVAMFRAQTTDALVTGPAAEGYTKVTAQDRGISHTVSIWYKVAGASESATVTFSTTTSVTSALEVFEFSGTATASVLDKFNSADGGATNITSLASGSTGTLGQADEVICTVVSTSAGNGGTEAIDSSFTIRDTGVFTLGTFGYKIVAATTAENPTHSWTTGRTAAGCTASFKAAGAAAQNVTPGLIDQTGAVFAPTVTQSVAPGLINQAGVVFAPQANLSVAPGLIDQTGVVFSPTVTQSVAPGLIDQTGVVFAPQVNQTVVIGFIDQTGVVFAPSISVAGGAQTVEPGLISQAGSVFAPIVTITSVLPALIDQTGVVFAPTVTQTLSPGLIDQTGVVFTPTVSQGSPTVSPALIDQTGVVFSPEVRGTSVTTLVDTSKWDRRGGDVVRNWFGWPRTEPRFYE